MKKNKNGQKNNAISFSSEEEKLLKKYIDEYNDLYQKILILSPNDFIQILKKMIAISLKEKFNGFSKEIKLYIEEFIVEKIYCHDYKYSLFAKRSLNNRKNNQYFSLKENEELIPHCDKCKKDGYYIHECGNKFQIYKYKPIHFSSEYNNIKCLNNLTKPKYLLFCSYCDMIYKSDLIKFKCNLSQDNFYSKITDKNENNDLPFATFKKYHCNIIISDCIKCQKCSENLYYKNENKIFCKKCDIEYDPKKLEWKCIKCKKDFTAEIKIYNPLEYKNMKICVKEAILNKKKVRPEYMGCNCKIDNINRITFFHKNSCKGTLYQWELNGKKVVVCQECESLGFYEGYSWTCPFCLKRFKINNKENNKNKEIKEIKEKKEKSIINECFSNSKNNFYNFKVNNNDAIYISPNKLKNKYSFNQGNLDNEINEKEKNENGKVKMLRRVNSAAKLNINRREKYQSGLPSPIKNLINNIKIVENKENKTPNITMINKNEINKEKEQKNNNNCNARYCKRNKIISNIDLNDVKKLNNIFNKYIGTEKKKEKSDYSLSPKNPKKNSDLKYKKNVVENSSKVINKTPLKKFKRSYSSCLKETKMNNINIKNENSRTPNKMNNKIPKYNNKKGQKSPEKEESTKKKISPGKFNINDYKIKRQIGEGSFGQIFLVEDKEKNQYALKKIIADSSDDINSIKQEYQILIDIQNNNKNINVVNIIGISNYKLDLTTHVLYVLMELASTDWEKEILKRKTMKKYYEEKELMNILSILVKSLSILQKQKISHRDLKPQNILVFYKNKNNMKDAIYKLADFGEAKELIRGDKPTNRQTLRGTELYMSPILFYALRASRIMKYVKHNTFKSDVFSFGLCALFAASLCFESLYDVRELKSNVSLKIVVNRYLKGRYSYGVIDIITKMLDINETTRLDFIELEKEFEKIGY